MCHKAQIIGFFYLDGVFTKATQAMCQVNRALANLVAEPASVA